MSGHPSGPTGHTRVAAVIGEPVRHSLSPALHNAAFSHCGLDWVYVALPVGEGRGADAVDAMRVFGLDGLSVTMPHKQAVAAAVDELSPAARMLGAVNCVQRVGDRLVGHNTDGAGLVASLRHQLGFQPEGAEVVVLGAGGAAAAASAALVDDGARVTIVNRSRQRAETLASAIGDGATAGETHDVKRASLVVQATPLGMGSDDALPIDPGLLSSHQLLVDLIYHPLETPLIAQARSRGVRAVNGVGMLLFQAGLQFTLWTERPAPIDVMAEAVGFRL